MSKIDLDISSLWKGPQITRVFLSEPLPPNMRSLSLLHGLYLLPIDLECSILCVRLQTYFLTRNPFTRNNVFGFKIIKFINLKDKAFRLTASSGL